ncbi:MAG TPA: hypothetical protein VGB42_08890 [Candidatus Thermoplasmatota archaeon]
MFLALGVGVFVIFYGFLTYLDWQWLDEHFGAGGSTRWTQDVVGGFLTRAILLFAVGGLGVATFVFGFLKVRKALDDDNQAAIKRWSFLTGVVAVLPGVGLSGLLELFIWRAHASERFTIFGLLGRAPEPPPEAPSPMTVATQQAEADEARRKQEYAALFGAPRPAAANPHSTASAYGSDSGYGQPQPAAQPQEYAPPYGPPQEPYAPAEAVPPDAPAAAPEAPPAAYHDQPSGAPICTCGRPMEWIQEYGRYYCYTDDRYEGEA